MADDMQKLLWETEDHNKIVRRQMDAQTDELRAQTRAAERHAQDLGRQVAAQTRALSEQATAQTQELRAQSMQLRRQTELAEQALEQQQNYQFKMWSQTPEGKAYGHWRDYAIRYVSVIDDVSESWEMAWRLQCEKDFGPIPARNGTASLGSYVAGAIAALNLRPSLRLPPPPEHRSETGLAADRPPVPACGDRSSVIRISRRPRPSARTPSMPWRDGCTAPSGATRWTTGTPTS